MTMLKTKKKQDHDRFSQYAIDKNLAELRQRNLYPALNTIARAHYVSLENILQRERTKTVRRARLKCYAYLRDMGMSYPEIGRIMMRDHVTIMKVLKRQQYYGADGIKT